MLHQFLTAFTASLAHTMMGVVNTWPSYTQDLLTANDTTTLSRPLTAIEAPLLGSLPSLGAICGTAIVSTIIERFGRRKGGLVMIFPLLISWSIIEMTTSPVVLLTARFLAGITSGAALVYSPMFISETAQESIRGLLASGPLVFYCLGALSSYLMGWFLSYHTIIWINIIMCAFGASMCMTMVESPVYLMKQNKDEDARVALAKYRGLAPSSKAVNEEIAQLRQVLRPQTAQEQTAIELLVVKTTDQINEKKPDEKNTDTEVDNKDLANIADTVSPLRKILTNPASRRAFIAVCFTGTCQVLMGMMPVQVYAKILFKDAAPGVSSNLCSVLLALVLLAGASVTAGISDRAGRRVLLMSSSAMVGTCLIILAILKQTSIAPSWVTAAMVFVYSFSFFCGACSVPYVLLAEVFSAEIQGVASMIFVQWIWFFDFLLIAVYPPLVSLLGVGGVFYIFAAIAFINVAGSFFIVPETKGLTYNEIQDKFARKISFF